MGADQLPVRHQGGQSGLTSCLYGIKVVNQAWPVACTASRWSIRPGQLPVRHQGGQ